MLYHAVGFAPFRLPAGAQVKMALFRAHDAAVTSCQLAEAGVTIALVETLLGGAIAMDTADHAIKIQPDLPPYQIIQRNAGIAHRQGIGYRVAGFGRHLAKTAGYINGVAQTLTSTN